MLGLIVGICSAVASACAAAATYVGTMVATFATKLVTMLAPIMQELPKILDIVDVIAKLLGITNEDTPEELGYKAMQAENSIDDFDSAKEYIHYLEKSIKIDEEKYANRTDVEKTTDQVLGTALVTKAISEEKNLDISPEFLVETGKQNLTGKQVTSIIETYKEHNAKLDLPDYLQGNLHGEEGLKSGDVFAEALGKLYPNLSREAIDEKIVDMMRVSVNYEGSK